MARFLSAARALLRKDYQEPPVHFHSASGAHVEVCDDERCARPRLELD